mgnify:CR=1 FL=1
MTVTRYGYSGVYKKAVKRYGYSGKSREGLRTKKNEQHR